MREYKMIESWYSGQVTRKHTMVNIRAENVAEHTWGVVHLIMMLWPGVPVPVLYAAQYHDFGEKATGDVPATVKWAHPTVAATFDLLENAHIQQSLPRWILNPLDSLTDFQKGFLSFCDRAELCLSQSRERRMGNTLAMGAFVRSYNKAEETYKNIAQEMREYHIPLWTETAHFWQELTNEKEALGKL